jgi:hypothetical protein
MAGFSLGGGYGALIGRFGLALDNLLAAEIVLADGRIVAADHDNEAELFWAVRGGGGNFGVVTTMRHRLHHMPSVRSGMLLYPFSEAKAILERCAEIAASAPEDLTVQVGCVAGPDGSSAVLIVPNWCGLPKEGEARVAPFRKLGTLLAGAVETTSYGASLTLFDAYIVNGQRALMETCWLPALDSGSIDVFIEAMETAVSPGCAVFTHEFRGAASRVPGEATAFGLRRDHVLVEILATFPERSDKLEEHRHYQWARATLRAFDAVALPGRYPNLLAEGDADRAAKSYGRTPSGSSKPSGITIPTTSSAPPFRCRSVKKRLPAYSSPNRQKKIPRLGTRRFSAGATAAFKDPAGKLYAIPWTADVHMARAARYDLFEKAGKPMPDTFDEVVDAMKAVHMKDGVPGLLPENHYGWSFIP